MPALEALPADRLRWRGAAEALAFASTAELPDLTAPIGQERAIEALRLALAVRADGYNVYALGPEGIGRHAIVRRLLEERAAGEPAPSDWTYVANFEEPRKPRLLALPPGRGRELQHDMAQLAPDLRDALRNAFENEAYRTRRQVIEEEPKERQEQAVSEVEEAAKTHGIALIRSPLGFAFAPLAQGRILPPEAFAALPEDRKAAIAAEVEALQDRLRKALANVPAWLKETRDRLRRLNDDTAAFAVGYLIETLEQRYAGLAEVLAYLDAVRGDVVAHVEIFLAAAEQAGEKPGQLEDGHPLFRRYRVNLLVDHKELATAPVVHEDDPTFERLVGRIEHRAEMGTLVTDLHMIRPGCLHRANGGYLILDTRKLLARPMAYEALKRALLAREVRLDNPLQALGLLTTQTLEPKPAPLSLKVVLVGERLLYYLAAELDPDFARLFKIAADFDEEVRRDEGVVARFARLLGTLARREALKPLDPSGVAAVLEHAARRAGHAAKLSTDVEDLADLLREADHWAAQAGSPLIGRDEVQRAVDSRHRRLDRLRERLLEEITEGTVAIATAGAVVGQVNGLAVLQLGGHAFGRPSRITARVRMGLGQVIDIEREVKLGGPIHSKGVLILSGLLLARFAPDVPVSLAATLVFEQSYGGVEGDSASLAELLALLSAIAATPVRQGLAVTGSVDQRGEAQAIGGVNEKVESFFDLCAARGLDGSQGVLIPAANTRHLMLHERVVAAAREGRFHVYPVATVDQAIELLTGLPAGDRAADGAFPEGSLNHRVEARLRRFAEQRRAFVRLAEEDVPAGRDQEP